jgi:hypothetical protein
LRLSIIGFGAQVLVPYEVNWLSHVGFANSACLGPQEKVFAQSHGDNKPKDDAKRHETDTNNAPKDRIEQPIDDSLFHPNTRHSRSRYE